MEIRAHYLIVGVVVLLLLGGLAGFAAWLVRSDIDQVTMVYEIAFEGSVTGLQVGSAVRYRGIPVGRVSEIVINPDNVEEVLVTAEIDAEAPIRRDTVASLELQGITGVAYVQLNGGTMASPPLESADSEPPRIMSRPSTLEQLFETTPDLLSRASSVVQRLDRLLNDANLVAAGSVLAQLDTFTATLAENSADIDQAISDATAAAQQVRRAAEGMDGLTADVSAAMVKLEARLDEDVTPTFEELRGTAEALTGAAAQLDAMVGELRQPLRDFSDTGLYQFSQMVGESRELVAALTRITKEFERDPTGFIIGGQRGFEAE